MLPFQDVIFTFLDTLTGHTALVIFLFAVMGERAWPRLKKLPPLLLSPLCATAAALGIHAVPELGLSKYYLLSLLILSMCTLWAKWAWHFGFWQALSATCMASIFQVAGSVLSETLFRLLPLPDHFQFAAAAGLHLAVAATIASLLYAFQFSRWFRLLLNDGPALRKTAFFLFALEAAMEAFLLLAAVGVQAQFLPLYYLLVALVVALTTGLVIYLAQRFDAARKIQLQQDAIAQQQLYEQDLEAIRQEIRAFRHDYKNLLAGLSQQVEAGQLDTLRSSLSELDAGFDRRLGERILSSTQIGNLQLPQVRSLVLSKLTSMREKGIQCRLEVLYPLRAVSMDVWDFVRCLGILMDNAIEAALDTDTPWVEIILLSQGGQVSLRVSNPWQETADPARFWEESWSTKGKGRGLGLSSYLQILTRYPNASPSTSWADGVFVQELTIGGTV